MKAYKVELLVLDFDELGAEGIKVEIENTKYANRCIVPTVKSCEERDIGEWSDEHPLNLRDKSDAEYRRLFTPCSQCVGQTLKMIECGFGAVRRTDIDAVLLKINEALKDTPFMFMLMGDGVKVVLREQILSLNKALANYQTREGKTFGM